MDNFLSLLIRIAILDSAGTSLCLEFCEVLSLLTKIGQNISSFPETPTYRILISYIFQVSYCENNIDCRRFLQLLHLGEKFNTTNCNRTCDNCSKVHSLVEKDVTDIARHLVGHLALTHLQFFNSLIAFAYVSFFEFEIVS
jgi:RecQ zinc-binding